MVSRLSLLSEMAAGMSRRDVKVAVLSRGGVVFLDIQ